MTKGLFIAVLRRNEKRLSPSKRTIGKLAVVLLLAFVAVTFMGASCKHTAKTENSDLYSIVTFASGNGWGYQISIDKKVVIYQSCMPCVKGNMPFPDEKSARRVGELVLRKFKNSGDPSITLDELNETMRISAR